MKENQASSTALTVLQGMLYTARNPEYAYLVDDELRQSCERILSLSEQGRKRLKQLDSWLPRQGLRLLERLIVPGIALHYVLRKRGIEDYALTQLKDGISQVIVLGAGLDTLAYRLSKKYPEVTFIEIDHPATQTLKAPFFNTAESGESANLHCLAIDFSRQTLEQELSQFPVFSADKPTLFICEGVLPYLTAAHVTVLFASLKQLCQHKLSFIFTALEPKNTAHHSLLKFYLQQKGEPIQWEVASTELVDFVTAQGFVLEDLATEQHLCERYLTSTRPQVLFEHEYLALVTR